MPATVTVDPMDIVCIRCGAGIGDYCQEPGAKRGHSRTLLEKPHRDRFALARVLQLIENAAAQCEREAREYAPNPALGLLSAMTKGQASGMRTAAETVRSMLGGVSP